MIDNRANLENMTSYETKKGYFSLIDSYGLLWVGIFS